MVVLTVETIVFVVRPTLPDQRNPESQTPCWEESISGRNAIVIVALNYPW